MAGAYPPLGVTRISYCPAHSGAIKNSFCPAGGLIAEQRGSAESSRQRPARRTRPGAGSCGAGAGLRSGIRDKVVDLDAAGTKANIFDDQWLGTLLATGILGFFGWLWLFKRTVWTIRAAEANATTSYRGWLLASIAAGDRGVRGWHAHVRRLRLHPGDVPVFHLRRHGLRARRRAADTARNARGRSIDAG